MKGEKQFRVLSVNNENNGQSNLVYRNNISNQPWQEN